MQYKNMFILYNFKIFKFCFVADMDDNNSGYEQTHSSCHPKAKKIRLKNLNTVKKANKPLENNPKISLAKRNDGRKTMLFF